MLPKEQQGLLGHGRHAKSKRRAFFIWRERTCVVRQLMEWWWAQWQWRIREDAIAHSESKLLGDDGHKDFCLTKDDCNAARKKAGYANNHFHSGTYRDHGCFTKNGKVFFGIGGTKKQMKITDLGGVKERFYCGGGGWEGDAHKPTDKPSKEPSKEPSKCLAHAACHISTFRSVQLQLTLFRYFSSHTHKCYTTEQLSRLPRNGTMMDGQVMVGKEGPKRLKTLHSVQHCRHL